MLIAVTGTPGTGKSHLARTISRKIRKAKVIEINDIVNRYKTFSGYDRFGTKIVKLQRLTDSLKKEINGSKSDFIVVVGHLAPDVGIKFDICIVLRSGLSRLESLMKRRGYRKEKIQDNVFAEAVDYCGETMRGKAKEIYEIETREEKDYVVKYLMAISENRKVAKPATKDISKMKELLTYLNSHRFN